MHAHKTDFKAMIANANLMTMTEPRKNIQIISAQAIRKMVQTYHPAANVSARDKK